ncbi:MAG: ATP-grasp domain-containing protein [Gemmatimonadales bacterium]
MNVLIVGVTARALAVSAARSGYRVTAVDAFGDLDLRSVARVLVPRPERHARFSPLAAVAAAAEVADGLAAYTSNLENYPEAVTRLGQHRQLLGNPADVLVRVRNPILLMRTLRSRGFEVPKTRATPAIAGHHAGSWLLKPRRSGGGHGIRIWGARQPVAKTSYLQEHITGIPGSVLFAADGSRAVPLGLSRQLVGDARLGASGFRYCGSLLATPGAPLFPRQEELGKAAAELASAVTEEFGLVGLNGLDFVARGGVPCPIEVNPRFSASMELIERAHGVSMFSLHLRACRGVLPTTAPGSAEVEGKAIVFARRDVVVGETRPWVEDSCIADVPHPGEPIARGRPICTVFARAGDAPSCHRLLIRRAAAVYRAVESRKRGAA